MFWYIDFVSCDFAKLISCSILFIDSLLFSTYEIMPSANKGSFMFLSNSFVFNLFLSCCTG